MPLNSDKPDRWSKDIAQSVELFNQWFLANAPKTFIQERKRAADRVRAAFAATADFTKLTPDVLREHPAVLQVLRMATLPPLARDRLIGLSGERKGLVQCLESGRLPPKAGATLTPGLQRICDVIEPLLDLELFPWRAAGRAATPDERNLGAFVVADRLCDALSNPILRNAHQTRQREILTGLLAEAGYVEEAHSPDMPINFMTPGTYAYAINVPSEEAVVAVDLVIQPKQPKGNRIPIITELKAAGDFTNVNKRRKEEANKFSNLTAKYGKELKLVLFLCGYFDRNYLQYEAASGIDWVWEHRPTDLLELLG